MAKLHENLKKFDPAAITERKVLGESTYDTLHPLGTQMVQARNARLAAETAANKAANEPVAPIPDEQALASARKKSLARRNRGRASTILGDSGGSETLG